LFRYSIAPHGPYDAAGAQRFGIERSQPLIAVPIGPRTRLPEVPPFRLEPAQAILTSLEPSRDGKAWMLRLINAGEKPCKARLTWNRSEGGRLHSSDLREESLSLIEGPLELEPLEIVTLRAERKR
jgi:alpha-mannosidase